MHHLISRPNTPPNPPLLGEGSFSLRTPRALRFKIFTCGRNDEKNEITSTTLRSFIFPRNYKGEGTCARAKTTNELLSRPARKMKKSTSRLNRFFRGQHPCEGRDPENLRVDSRFRGNASSPIEIWHSN